VLGLDVARSGLDRTVACHWRDPVVRSFHWWQGADTQQTADRVAELCRSFGMCPYSPRNAAVESVLLASPLAALVMSRPGEPEMEHAHKGAVRVDVIGVGAGVYDALLHQGWDVDPFNASALPGGGKRQRERFLNRRAQAFWSLRKLLEDGAIALPEEFREELAAELLAVNWAPSHGKVQIESKDDIKVKLGGKSPDFADVLAMAVGGDGVVRFGPGEGRAICW
jgi:hypothetical protein